VRDVLLSTYKREMAVGCINGSLDDYIRPFMEGRMSHWGSWQSHAASWIHSPLAESGDLLVLRYEDMRKDPQRSIRRCLDFLGRTVESSVIEAALQSNSLERMREKEQLSKRMVKIKGDGRQINSGVIERWRTALTPQQLEIVDEYAGEMLAYFGYPIGTGSVAEPLTARQMNRPSWDSSVPVQFAPPISAGCLRHFSPIDLKSKNHPADTRELHIRVGGRIANLFSWYPY
jgi:hypothetical protein